MTNGTSQGLFVIVAVVIFGIFVLISYVLFRDTLKPSLANIFTDSLEQATDSLKGEGVSTDLEENSIFNFDKTTGSIKGFIEGYIHDSSELTIPRKINGVIVKHIESEAFLDAKFTSVNLPEGLESIGDMSFFNSNVTKLTIPNSVKYIGGSAFENSEIKTLDLGSGVETIHSFAFTNSRLSKLIIPNSVKYIGGSAFGYSVNYASFKLNLTLGNNVEHIGYSAFESYIIDNLVIPDSVKTIEDDAFGIVKKLTLGNGIETIGGRAFYGLETADDLIIPDSVKEIGRGAFGKSKAKKLILSKNIESIGDYAFGEVDLTNLLDKSDYKNLNLVGENNPIFK